MQTVAFPRSKGFAGFAQWAESEMRWEPPESMEHIPKRASSVFPAPSPRMPRPFFKPVTQASFAVTAIRIRVGWDFMVPFDEFSHQENIAIAVPPSKQNGRVRLTRVARQATFCNAHEVLTRDHGSSASQPAPASQCNEIELHHLQD